jgi:hypothetical protein
MGPGAAPLLATLESEEKKEEGITHHGCGAAGAPSGLRSLSLLPAPQKPCSGSSSSTGAERLAGR